MKDPDSYLLEMLDAGGLESKNFSINDFLKVYLEYSQNDHWFSQSREMSLISSFVVLIVLGIVSNGLVCFIIVRNGIRKSSRNLYIMNLAISDILTCVLCKPLSVVRLVLKNWTLGEALCRLVPSLQTVYVFVSTLTLVALAVDRYRAITNNGNSIRSRLLPCYGLAFIWIVSVAIAAPLFAVHHVEEVKGFNGYVMYNLCLEQWRSPVSLTIYTVIVLLLQYLSPLLAIVILHLLIGSFLRMHITDGPYRLPDLHLRRKRCRHRKNMILLTSMAAAFAVAWLPLNLVNTLATIYPEVINGGVKMGSSILFSTNVLSLFQIVMRVIFIVSGFFIVDLSGSFCSIEFQCTSQALEQ